MEKICYPIFGNTVHTSTGREAKILPLPIKNKRVKGSGKRAGTECTVEPIRNMDILREIRGFFISECEKTEAISKKNSCNAE